MILEELAIADGIILRKIIGPIKEGISTRGGITMNFINILRKLQILLEKEELLFTDFYKE